MRGYVWVLGALCALQGAIAEGADYGVEALVAQLRAAHVHSVDEAVRVLPPAWRENYVLVFQSRSLQSSTPAAPRAILYGPDATFIVSFNGADSERGATALETMEFDPRANTFHYRELSFSATGDVEVSVDNPARCAACHGRPAHPIWDTPPTWPGVYGERYRAGLSRAEAKGMAEFLARQPQDPRYSSLIRASRFADRATYVGTPSARYSGDGFEPPNARLSSLLSELNARALVAQLAQSRQFEPLKYALLGAATPSCGDLPSYFPSTMRAGVARAADAYDKNASNRASVEGQMKRIRQASEQRAYEATGAGDSLRALRFLSEAYAGMPPQRWSLALERDSEDLTESDGRQPISGLLFHVVALGDPSLRDRRQYRSYAPDDGYCRYLKERSEVALLASGDTVAAAFAGSSPAGPPPAMDRPALLGLCAGCHTGEVGPKLPFGDADALAASLVREGYPHGRLLDEILFRLTPAAGANRMPRGLNPSADEQLELENYFLKVAARR